MQFTAFTTVIAFTALQSHIQMAFSMSFDYILVELINESKAKELQIHLVLPFGIDTAMINLNSFVMQ